MQTFPDRRPGGACRYRAGYHQRGITLIEMMVAVAVGLILLAGIIQLFVSNKQAYRIQEGTNVMNENARYALNQIQYHLRMGDHWGGVEADGVDVDGGIDALGVDCTESPIISSVGIIGFDGDSADSPLDCIPDADYVAETDIVVVRYGAPARVASGDLADTSLYVRAAIGRRAIIFQGEDVASLPGDIYDAGEPDPDPIANYAFNTIIYFIRPCASQDRGTAGLCDAADDSTPTLARLVLRGDVIEQEDIIAGVEQMQVSYGIDTNGDLAADTYQAADAVTAADDWNKVVDVRLSLIIRNAERDATANPDDTVYRLYGGVDGDGVEYEVPDDAQQFRRKVFNTSIQVRNLTRG